MLRRLFMIFILGLFTFGFTGLSFAQTEVVTQARPEEIINVGNKICPVSGEKIGEEMGPVTYEYEGKIYNFCCASCVDEFRKDPQKYIKKVEEELQGEAKEEVKEEGKIIQEPEASEGAHEGHHH